MTINPNKALWEKGDFTRIAESMRESGEALVMTLGITDGLEVLDLGCGDGTTAVPAAFDKRELYFVSYYSDCKKISIAAPGWRVIGNSHILDKVSRKPSAWP